MDISKYSITTPFGQVAGYPLNNGFHNGIDYGLPMGTPVIVNGVTIGLSNNTGASTGPHLHVGKYVNGAVQNPGVGNGFNFNSAAVYDTGYSTTNGNFVRITGDGALWNYLHLEKVLVIKGQILKGNNMSVPIDLLRIIASEIEGFDSAKTHAGTYDKILTDAWGSQPVENYIRHAWAVNPNKRGNLLDRIQKLEVDGAAKDNKIAALEASTGVNKTSVVAYINAHLN